MRWTACRVLVLTATLIFSGPVLADAEPAAQLLDNPAIFNQMLLWSFQLDKCGDPQSGDALRKALYEKVESCPFTDSAKNEFRNWRTLETAVKDDIRRKFEKRRELAEAPLRECEALKQSLGIKKLVDHLRQYAEGRAGFDAVISERCDQLPDGRD